MNVEQMEAATSGLLNVVSDIIDMDGIYKQTIERGNEMLLHIQSQDFKEKESLQWNKTSEKLPERAKGKSYSQVWCLVVKRYEREYNGEKSNFVQTQILVFNHEHQCWDGDDGDDYDCDIEKVIYWMLLPAI